MTKSRDRAPRTRGGRRRAVAVLVLVALGALIPLLGPSPALHGTGEADAPGTGGIALLRTVLFAALAVPVGELFAVRLARGLPGAPSALPRSWSTVANSVGFVAALGLASVVATGNLLPASPADMDLGGLYETRDGKLALLEVNGFLAAALCSASRRPVTQVLPLAAVVVAEALRAHPTTEYGPLVGSGLTLVHLTCASLWVGGLPHVLRTLRLWGHAEAGAALLGRYARVALVLLAAITATGVCSSLRRMPSGTILTQLTDTAYGRVLLAKVVLMAGASALALWARVRLARAADPLTARSPARAEVCLLALVVAVSGLLTALPVPIRW
ncbi:copper resistance D family protein [Streptomyces albogriseolus]|uniref:copper resistance D family protein n=1 Tax=Streptomyces TaxID=1883 RepID=UPI00225B6E16|nr:CopD family protein [Streptomyces viridodiastaticus]MCX4566110.1 CopD family protein [Streptomyces viridodiastaticus]